MSTRPYDTVAAALDARGSRAERMTRVVEALWPALAPTGVSWLGFYVDRPGEPDDRRLVLEAHRDKPACSPIGLHGVCGGALLAAATRIVHDVADLGEAYIPCDPRDRSEIVVPLLDEHGRAWAVLDLDSHETGSFGAADDAGLRRVLAAAGL